MQMYQYCRLAVEDGVSHLASYLDGLDGKVADAEVVKALLEHGITRATDILYGCYGEN